MNYYKMFKDDVGIGVINSFNFKFINPVTQRTIIVPENQAICIEYCRKYYCTLSMPVSQMQNIPYQFVEIIPITEEEYNEYIEAKAKEEDKQIIYPEVIPQTIPQPNPDNEQPKMTIQEMRDKITKQEQQIQLLTNYILELN